MLLNPYRFAASSTLLTGLVSWWSLDEASGSRADSHGSNTLTDNNTVTQAAGKIGNAGQFTTATAEYLSVAAGHGLGGGTSFTAAAWVYPDTIISNGGILRVGSGNGITTHDWLLATQSTYFKFFKSYDSTWEQLNAATYGAPALSTWQFVMAEYDIATKTLGIQINNGTKDTATHTGTTATPSQPFEIGRYHTSEWNGRIDEAAFWSRLLTTEEKAELYNSGTGIAYPG